MKKPPASQAVAFRPTIGEHWVLVTGIGALPAPGWAEGNARLELLTKLLDGSSYEEWIADPPVAKCFGDLIVVPVWLTVAELRQALKLIDAIVGTGRVLIHQFTYLSRLKERIETLVIEASRAPAKVSSS